ncbi:MAG: T9SS type A sorting domain-containing protein [Bacteroidetes bacterium]|nr:T9SS type A sorting domain-containing protein [Bacteroidota bacterium]
MRHFYLIILGFFFYTSVNAQTTADYAVQLTAAVQVAPPGIKLSWVKHTDNPTYYIYRKSKTAQSWGTAIDTLTAADSTYTDNNVVADSAYEYQVVASGTTATGQGYIFAGIRSPALHSKGALIMLVDSTFTDSLSAELSRLKNDIRADGWEVIRYDISRNVPDSVVKATIKNVYNTNPRLRAVLIVGHIAVPYSGDINPDGHPDHLGAWPADLYYGNMDGLWTDNTVNDTSAGYVANRNKPGDGKWDQDGIPTPNRLQVSRIDFYDMPLFNKTEIAMMRSYLNKDHVYKWDSLAVVHRALISDNFGAFGGEAFAATGFRNFPPLVGTDSVKSISYISTLNTDSYQWSYGCGGGSFQSAGGIGSTSDFTTNNVNGIFTMLFGSYFGDWNAQNDFMRAPLCSDVPALTVCWSGRPHWFFHHMALGENIGYDALVSQNNQTLYLSQNFNYGATWVHAGLMGDLTLRTDYIKPVSNLAINTFADSGALLTWTASPDTAVHGYYVYRCATAYGSYQKISPMLAMPSYLDTVGTDGLQYYMVRPVKLTTTPSGTYYNLGLGEVDTATVTYQPVSVGNIASMSSLTLYPNPAKTSLSVSIEGKAGNATFRLMNVNGQVVKEYSRYLPGNKTCITFDVSKLPAGVYTLSAEMKNFTETKQWIKLN